MTVVLVGLFCFSLALAAWRWGLGNRNWLEGTLAAAAFTGVVVSALWFVDGVLRARSRAIERQAGVLTSGAEDPRAPAGKP